MKLYIKEKVFSWGEKFFVKDALGEDKYTVEGPAFSIGKKLYIYDMFGRELAFIQQQLFTRSFVTMVSRKNRRIGAQISVEQFFEMEHVAVTLSGKSEESYDGVIDDTGRRRRIVLTTPHFLTVPLIIEHNPHLVATVPRELGKVFAGYKAVRMVETPIKLPQFAIRQHWHPRYHHDAANSWLRRLLKETFEGLEE